MQESSKVFVKKRFKNLSNSSSASYNNFSRQPQRPSAKFEHSEEYHPQKNLNSNRKSIYFGLTDQSAQNTTRTNFSIQTTGTTPRNVHRSNAGSNRGSHSSISKQLQHKTTVLKKQITKLTKQLERADEKYTDLQNQNFQIKEVEAQLVQTYRVINYYEGKNKQQDKIITFFEGLLQKNDSLVESSRKQLKQGLDFKNIIEFFRNQNIELKGQLQQLNHQNVKLKSQLRTKQLKIYRLQQKLRISEKKNQAHINTSGNKQATETGNNANTAAKVKNYKGAFETNNLQSSKQKAIQKSRSSYYQTRLNASQKKLALRKNDDQLSQASSARSNQSRQSGGFRPQRNYTAGIYTSRSKSKDISHKLGQRLSQNQVSNKLQQSKFYGNISSKINKIEQDLDYFKLENCKLSEETVQLVAKIGQLTKENDELRFRLQNQYSSSQPPKNLIMKHKTNNNDDPLNKVTILHKTTEQFQPINKQYSSDNKNRKIPNDYIVSSTLTTTKYGSSNSESQYSTRSNKSSSSEIPSRCQGNGSTLQELSKKIRQLNQPSQSFQPSQQQPQHLLLQKYFFNEITSETIRKLRFNLIRQDITYEKMIDIIAEKLAGQEPNLLIEVLQDIPYLLSSKQSSQFMFQFKKIQAYLKGKQLSESSKAKRDLSAQQVNIQKAKQIKVIFKENIPPFKNITIRRDATLTSQISKLFINRYDEIKEFTDKKQLRPFQKVDNMLRFEWNLSDAEIDFIFLKSCEESGKYDLFDFSKTVNFFLEN